MTLSFMKQYETTVDLDLQKGMEMQTLNEEQIWAIWKDRRRPLKVVAYDHGVSISTVWAIQHGERHIEILRRLTRIESEFREGARKRKEETNNHKG